MAGTDKFKFSSDKRYEVMSDENVEFNEIRCNTLILGNKDTGTISLRIDDEDGTPNLFISGGDEEQGIYLGFNNDSPVLAFVNKNGKREGVIGLKFNDEGYPVLTLSRKRDENENVNEVKLGFDESGDAVLRLSNGQNEDSAVVSLSVDDDGSIFLFLANRNVKGGNIFFSVDKTDAGIAITSTDRMQNRDAPWGLYIATGIDGSKLEIESKNYIDESRQNKEADSEV